MRRVEAIDILNEEMVLWARILGKFRNDSYWFKKGFDRLQALRMATDALKREKEKMPWE